MPSIKKSPTPTKSSGRKPALAPNINQARPSYMNWLPTAIETIIFLAIGLTPLLFSPLSNELFEFPKMIFIYSLAIVGLVFIGLDAYMNKRILLPHPSLGKPIILFLLVFGISTLFSLDIYTSVMGYYSRFNGGLASLIAYLILAYLVYVYLNLNSNTKYHRALGQITKNISAEAPQSSEKPASQINPRLLRIVWVWLLSSMVVSLWAIMEHFGYDPSCYLLTGNIEATCWIQDVQARVFATFGQPNWLAAYLVATLPLALTMLLISQHRYGQIAAWLAASLGYAALWYTYSRSGWIGLAAAIVLLLPLVKMPSFRQRWPWLLSLIVACTVISLSSFSMAAQRTATSLETGELDSSTGQIRLLVWQGSANIIKQYPLFGSGPETFAYSFLPHRPAELNQTTEWNFLYNKAHNEVLQVAATLGLIGLLAWLFIYFKLGQFIWQHHHYFSPSKITANNALTISLFAGIVGVLTAQLLGFSVVATSILFWVVAAIIAANSSKASALPLSSQRTLMALVALLVIALLAGFGLFRYTAAEVLATKADGNFNKSSWLAAHQLNQATKLNPYEPKYQQQLSLIYAFIAQRSNDQEYYVNLSHQTAQKALQLNPHNILNLKGIIYTYQQLAYVDQQYLQTAVEVALQAQALDSNDVIVYQTLGNLYLQAGKPNEALDALNKLVALRDKDPNSYVQRAKFFQKTSQPHKATADLGLALTIDPEHVEAQKMLKEIQGNITQ